MVSGASVAIVNGHLVKLKSGMMLLIEQGLAVPRIMKEGAGFLACASPSVLLVIAIDARTVVPIVGRYLALTVFRGLFED